MSGKVGPGLLHKHKAHSVKKGTPAPVMLQRGSNHACTASAEHMPHLPSAPVVLRRSQNESQDAPDLHLEGRSVVWTYECIIDTNHVTHLSSVVDLSCWMVNLKALRSGYLISYTKNHVLQILTLQFKHLLDWFVFEVLKNPPDLHSV